MNDELDPKDLDDEVEDLDDELGIKKSKDLDEDEDIDEIAEAEDIDDPFDDKDDL